MLHRVGFSESFEDITISESRGWSQLKISLSKKATETFTIDYKFDGGDATANEDYWWWSDNTGYRQVTFVKGQKTAVINVDVRNDSLSESEKQFIEAHIKELADELTKVTGHQISYLENEKETPENFSRFRIRLLRDRTLYKSTEDDFLSLP